MTRIEGRARTLLRRELYRGRWTVGFRDGGVVGASLLQESRGSK